MARDSLKTKFYKFIYNLDKEMNKEEGKYTPDFDTWLKNIEKKEDNNLKKQKNKMNLGMAMSSLAKNTENKKAKKTYKKSYQKNQRQNDKLRYDKTKKIYNKEIKDYDKEIEKIKLRKEELKKAIIYSEIIGKPKAKR
ncbi:MAG: hypothetical protein E6296_07355 [Anaerococcus vaginalis]|nr:hypothetical protein [Anaerococcus vaginalis]